MAEISTQQALAKLKKLVRSSPGVEQDLNKWSDVQVEEIEPGQWKMLINADDVIYFSYYELTINELYAARGFTEKHPKGTEFQPAISIDSPKGGKTEPGALASLTREQVRQQVRDTVERVGIPERTPAPEPTLMDRVKKLVRMIRLRMRL